MRWENREFDNWILISSYKSLSTAAAAATHIAFDQHKTGLPRTSICYFCLSVENIRCRDEVPALSHMSICTRVERTRREKIELKIHMNICHTTVCVLCRLISHAARKPPLLTSVLTFHRLFSCCRPTSRDKLRYRVESKWAAQVAQTTRPSPRIWNCRVSWDQLSLESPDSSPAVYRRLTFAVQRRQA